MNEKKQKEINNKENVIKKTNTDNASIKNELINVKNELDNLKNKNVELKKI